MAADSGQKFVSPSSVWALARKNGKLNVTSRPELNRFIVEIPLQRKSQYYVLSVFLPLMVLMALMFVGLILPPEEPDRATFAVTVMLAFSV